MEPKPPSVPVNVLELREPLQFGERTITELSFRKPIAKDMRALPGDPAQYSMGTLLDFAARLCGEPVSVIDRLSLEDTMTVVNLISGFFESSPGTGPQA